MSIYGMENNKLYKVIDLFAGAGGLSLGFMQTNKFEIKVAFENNPVMQKTYKKNHPNVDVRGDVCAADYEEIKRQHGEIDVVIGGPPCQGFSNANRQKNHAVNNNNLLVKQYLRAILELKPKAFVMENVSMLKSDVHRFFMTKEDENIESLYGISPSSKPLILLDGQYIFDGVKELINDQEQVITNLWDENDYIELNVVYKTTKNAEKLARTLYKHETKLKEIIEKHLKKNDTGYITTVSKRAFAAISDYYAGKLSVSEIKQEIEPAIMLQRMLSRIREIRSNNIIIDEIIVGKNVVALIKSFTVFDYLEKFLENSKDGYAIYDDILCAADYGAPQKRMRFFIVGIKKSISSQVALPEAKFVKEQYRTVKDAIEDLEDVSPVFALPDDENGIELLPKEGLSVLAKELRNSKVLRNHIITKTTDTAMARFKALKQGENFHALAESMKTNTYTDATRTQNTIYLRLNYNEPCGTVVNVRKSMWIHPTLDRAISVREAARLQTFPDSFIFYGSKDKQYQQVGNAVPPMMAKAIAEKLATILHDNMPKIENEISNTPPPIL